MSGAAQHVRQQTVVRCWPCSGCPATRPASRVSAVGWPTLLPITWRRHGAMTRLLGLLPRERRARGPVLGLALHEAPGASLEQSDRRRGRIPREYWRWLTRDSSSASGQRSGGARRGASGFSTRRRSTTPGCSRSGSRASRHHRRHAWRRHGTVDRHVPGGDPRACVSRRVRVGPQVRFTACGWGSTDEQRR